ncbi:MAG: hypothetical protein LBU84_08790 [Prevotella sp.]|jgi:hypothetical protein|nr:hypothetical protein [Prevotella sp.]
MEEKGTFIDSITIHFPSFFVNGETPILRELFKAKYRSRYYRYGNISLITINRSFFKEPLPLWNQIKGFIDVLKNAEIINKELPYSRIMLHKITLCFFLDLPELIFCKICDFPGFTQKNRNVYIYQMMDMICL